MKIREVTLLVGTKAEFRRHILEATIEDAGKHYLALEPKQVAKFFSSERMRLLRAIREHPEYGVGQLAEYLGRKQEAISRDVAILRASGIVEREQKQKNHSATKAPIAAKTPPTPDHAGKPLTFTLVL